MLKLSRKNNNDMYTSLIDVLTGNRAHLLNEHCEKYELKFESQLGIFVDAFVDTAYNLNGTSFSFDVENMSLERIPYYEKDDVEGICGYDIHFHSAADFRNIRERSYIQNSFSRNTNLDVNYGFLCNCGMIAYDAQGAPVVSAFFMLNKLIDNDKSRLLGINRYKLMCVMYFNKRV